MRCVIIRRRGGPEVEKQAVTGEEEGEGKMPTGRCVVH